MRNSCSYQNTQKMIFFSLKNYLFYQCLVKYKRYWHSITFILGKDKTIAKIGFYTLKILFQFISDSQPLSFFYLQYPVVFGFILKENIIWICIIQGKYHPIICIYFPLKNSMKHFIRVDLSNGVGRIFLPNSINVCFAIKCKYHKTKEKNRRL